MLKEISSQVRPDGVLGVTEDDLEVVHYQYGVTGLGDILEEGTVVKGSCYEW